MSKKKPLSGIAKGVKPKLAISSSVKKIDSIYAKYTSGGLLLSCSLCNLSIKSELFWTAHVSGRQHRDNLVRIQKEKEKVKQDAEVFLMPGATTSSLKRSATKDDGPPTKKKAEIPSDFFDKPGGVSRLKVTQGGATTVKPKSILRNVEVSSDESKKAAFLAASLTNGTAEMQVVSGGAFKDIEKPLKIVDTTIPEGFFDDPKMDAKARNVEYKDPQVEEWERFQREMKEMETVSENIIEEDSEIATSDRQLEEIDEQLHRWNRVLEMEKKKEDLVPVPKTSDDVNMSSDDEEDNLDALLDWRLKGTKLKR